MVIEQIGPLWASSGRFCATLGASTWGVQKTSPRTVLEQLGPLWLDREHFGSAENVAADGT